MEQYLLPSERTNVEDVTREILDEMSLIYALQVETNPQRLIFPKTEYARSITVFDAALIVNQAQSF